MAIEPLAPLAHEVAGKSWEEFWNGVNRSYIPGEHLRIPERLLLHTAAATDIDAATFEVVRFALFNANLEHSDVIQRTSASPIVVITRDFNTALLTEDAELVYVGNSLQYMIGQFGPNVAWTMEHRGDSPGIDDGDMFLVNDPWIGTAHQQDVNLLTPVFADGKLFCWLASSMHQTDIGGNTPGSFCVSAKDVYDEANPMPPIKIVEGDRIRRDIEELYLRSSRLPGLVALDLRGQINGARAARAKLETLIERYGAAVVKGTMRRILDNAERAFVEKIAPIPDGQWRERLYQEAAFDGDRRTHAVYLTLTKQDDLLIFENTGTARSEGILSLTFGGWQGGILSAVHGLLAYDQMGCIGGAQRHIRYQPTPGLATCVEHPAAISAAGTYNTLFAVGAANGALARMMSCGDETTRASITAAAWTLPGWCFAMTPPAEDGSFAACPMLDGMIGAVGPYDSRDGVDASGFYHIPVGEANNVEDYEQLWPMLYLYRQFETQAMGDDRAKAWGWGRHRGGRSFTAGLIPWHTDELIMVLHTEEVVPKQLGLFGGYLGSVNFHRHVIESDVPTQFAQGRIPRNFGEVGGEVGQPVPKGPAYMLNSRSMWEWNSTSTGGYGDPLERLPAAIAEDLRSRIVDEQTAVAMYGAVIAADGLVDDVATTARQLELARARVAGATVARSGKAAGTRAHRALDHLAVVDSGGGRVWACDRCDERLGGVDDNYKDGTAVIRTLVKDLPGFRDPARHVDELFEYRQFCCPGCGVILDSEIANVEHRYLHDLRLG